ncbi:class D sortase [Rossellomorea vietnamensis]|nr:class D sortase [Rossellomorea vietnamensis]
MKKIISIFIILSGLGVMAYPKAADYVEAYHQDKLLKQWESEMASTSNEGPISSGSAEETAQTSYINLDDVFNPSARTSEVAASERERSENALGSNMLGIITIDVINVNLPILRGASQYNLKYGAGHLNGTAIPGKTGNSAIAAHRSREQGKMFNRLGELQMGDAITVKTRSGTFQYKVTDTKVVEPTDLSVLQESDEEILTLITCDPIENPVNRLIVRAEMQ